MEIFDESTLSEYEVLRQRNIISNYEFMKSCGLPVKPLIYVERKKVSPEELYKYESDESEEEDDDWSPSDKGSRKIKEQKNEEKHSEFKTTKVHNPSKFFDLKKKAIKSRAEQQPSSSSGFDQTKKQKYKSSSTITKPASSTIVRPEINKVDAITTRPTLATQNNIQETLDDGILATEEAKYPKRNVQRKNYREEEIPDSDHYLYCDQCNDFFPGECALHGKIIPLPDNLPVTSDMPKSRSSLPDGLQIKQSNIFGAGLGVFALQAFEIDTMFGPYQGSKVSRNIDRDKVDTSYMWEIMKDGKIAYYIDGKDDEQANWLKFVNCSRTEHEQNLISLQYHGEIYYRAYKPIKPGEELLVWYGEEYARDLGIDTSDHIQPLYKLSDPGNIHSCQVCGMCFSLEKYLVRHNTHCKDQSNSKWKCDMCGKGYCNAGALKAHKETIHLKLAKYECSICKKTCKQATGLKYHILTHTGERSHQCEYCGKKFNLKGSLNRHIRIHTNEQPFKCNYCEMAFAVSNNLTYHLRIHTGEKPYKCDNCGKAFTHLSALKRHILLHTGERPYKCDICGNAFNVLSNLKRHKKTHPDVHS